MSNKWVITLNRTNHKQIWAIFILSILFISSVPLFYAAASITYFIDGFESGNFSAWTGTKSVSSGVASSVQTQIKLSGANAMRVTIADDARESGNCQYKDLGASYSAINARVYVQLSAVPAWGSVLEILGFSSDGWLPNALGVRLDIVNFNGTAQWRFIIYNNGWQETVTGSISPNVWYCIEVRIVFGSGSGESRFYVDGIELATKTGLTNTALGSSVRYFCLGVDDELGGNTLNVYFDSVILSDSYIGSEPTSTPTPTPTTSPTATPTTSPSPSPTPTATPTANPTPTPSPSPTATPTPTPIPTPTPTPTPNPTYLFSDNFENGNLNAWTGTKSVASGVTASVQTATKHEGAYALKMAVADGAQESGVCVYKDLGATYNSINARVYVQLTANPAFGSTLEIFGFSSNGWIPNAVGARIDIVNDNSVIQWRVVYYNNGWQVATVGPINLNSWYCIELRLVIGSGNGETRLYIDGAEAVTKTGLTNTAPGSSVRYLSLGLDDELGSNTLNTFFDDIAVSQNYIGPTVPSPSPTPTPAPTVTPTPTPSPSPSPSPTPTPSPTATPSPSPSPTPTTTIPPTSTYNEANITKSIQAAWIANDGTLYASSDNVVYKSLNQGETWHPLLTFHLAQGVSCVYVSAGGNVFASPDTSASSNGLGLWRSGNGGQTWSRVLPLLSDCTIWSMAEDSLGNLFAGIYTTGSIGNASILKSTDGGAHWSIVYYDSGARHIHSVAVDKANNYVYAALGDYRVNPNWQGYVIRATDDGLANSSWQKLLDVPQMTTIEVVNSVDSQGRLIPLARLFGTDYDNGQIYRTTDDINFDLVFDTGVQSYGFWIRTNSFDGRIYASFVGGEHPSQWVAGIWVSNNNGVSWTLHRGFPIHYPYYGSAGASNFANGVMYYSVQLDSGWQNGTKLYPDYSDTAQTAFEGMLGFVAFGGVWLAASLVVLTKIKLFVTKNKERKGGRPF